MIDVRLLTAFPLIPLFAAIIAIAASAGRRDWSGGAIRLAIALQTVSGLWLSLGAVRGANLRAPLGDTSLAIEFAFGLDRVPLTFAYLTPLWAAAARLHQLHSPSLRLVLLFYMGGCSGLIVTSDLFNFFVFYELMVMAAYVLVGAKGRLYASVKYLLFGGLSSVFLLSGIVLLYATGAGFADPLAPQFLAADPLHQRWTLLLLATAFLLKSAFVPAWTWLATCHAATVTPISAMLGSFTVMTGLWGLQTRVLAPAAAIGLDDLRIWIETLSVASTLIPSLFVLVEADPKRSVAASSVVAVGFISWLMTRGRAADAMLYIVVHAVGKTLMFHSLEEMEPDGRMVASRRRSAFVLAAGAILAIGLFPTPIGVWKTTLADAVPAGYLIVATATACTLAGLLKFSIRRGGQPPPAWLMFAASTSLTAAAVAGIWIGFTEHSGMKWASDLATLLLALVIGRVVNRWSAAWSPSWRRRPYPHLNAELLSAAVLFTTGAIWLILPFVR